MLTQETSGHHAHCALPRTLRHPLVCCSRNRPIYAGTFCGSSSCSAAICVWRTVCRRTQQAVPGKRGERQRIQFSLHRLPCRLHRCAAHSRNCLRRFSDLPPGAWPYESSGGERRLLLPRTKPRSAAAFSSQCVFSCDDEQISLCRPCKLRRQSIVSEKVEEQIDIELRLIRPEPRSATAPLGSAAGPNVGRSRELLSILYNSGLSPHNALFERSEEHKSELQS